MAEQGEFRFEIADLTPMTLSMRRLKEYLQPLVELFGYEDRIHFIRVDDGSAASCIVAENHMVKSVQQRLLKIKSGHGSREAYKAQETLNEMLAEDKTSAVLRSPSFGLVIEFPGIKRAVENVVGPIKEYCEIQGELIQIGGRDETISLYIRDGRKIFICTATREQGREIVRQDQLFRRIRLSGMGSWVRNEIGKWELVDLVFGSFRPLSEEPLSESIQALRALSESVEGERVPIDPE